MNLPSATLALPVALALVGAGVGGAVLTGTNPLALLNSSKDAAEPPKGLEVVEQFTGDVGDATQGMLDLRTFWGNIHLAAWDEPSWELTVYEYRSEGGQQLGDAGIEVQFEDLSTPDMLNLKLAVVPTGTAAISINEGHHVLAIEGFVPASLLYTEVLACSGASHGFEAIEGVFESIFDRDDEESEACVEDPSHLRMNFGRIQLQDSDEAEVEEVPFLIEGLEGGKLLAFTQYGDLGVSHVGFDEAGLFTQYGDLAGVGRVGILKAITQYGDGNLELNADELEVLSQYGDLRVAVNGGGSGAYHLMSQYGSILLGVPRGAERGYDASASTQYGEVQILLEGVEEATEKEEGAAPAPALPIALDLDGKKKHRESTEAAARTPDFDSRPIQVTIEALGQYGDILITDGELPEVEQDEDHK